MKHVPLVLLVLLCLALGPSDAAACSCGHQLPCEAFGEATTVFIGRVLEGTEKVDKESTSGNRTSYEAGIVRFSIEEVFKGGLGSEVSLRVASNKGTSCGPYGLARGEKYLVYGYGDATSLSTGVCTRTTILSKGDEDLQFLRNLPERGTGGRLSGRIWLDKGEGASPLQGITIVVRGAGSEQLKAISNDKGEFELTSLKPGKYGVEPIWPKNYVSQERRQEVNVYDRGCTRVGFEAKLDGRLAGRVFDSSNRPVSLMLVLEAVDTQRRSRTNYGHSREGSFEIGGVPPGNYILYVQLEAEDWKNNKKYYYPGVTEQQDATVIRLGLGEKLDGYDFQIPPEFAVRTVEGHVVWPDGSPAAQVEVLLICPRSTRPEGYTLGGPSRAVSDANGRFRVQGFTGTSYWIEARGRKNRSSEKSASEFHSPERPLVIEQDLTNVRLVLSEVGFGGECGKLQRQK